MNEAEIIEWENKHSFHRLAIALHLGNPVMQVMCLEVVHNDGSSQIGLIGRIADILDLQLLLSIARRSAFGLGIEDTMAQAGKDVIDAHVEGLAPITFADCFPVVVHQVRLSALQSLLADLLRGAVLLDFKGDPMSPPTECVRQDLHVGLGMNGLLCHAEEGADKTR